MSIFKQNMKNNVLDIIKYECSNDALVWKHPKEDFYTYSQLIVHESQEALFMLDGRALDLFGPGRHTLETQNLPIISKEFNLLSGGISKFHCEVYFINKTHQMSLKWGLNSKIRYVDPQTGVPLEVGAYGELDLQVSESRKLLSKLVGTMKGIAWDTVDDGFANAIKESFRPLISQKVRTILIQVIKEENIDLLDIDQYYERISLSIKNKINPEFGDYGLTISRFYLSGVSFPDNDPNFLKIKFLHETSLKEKTIEAEKSIRIREINAETDIAAVQRTMEIEKQLTQTAILRKEAERKIIEAETETETYKKELERTIMRSQAEAQSIKNIGYADSEILKSKGLAEAEAMLAKGYTEKDVLQAEVKKAYAEGIGQFGSNSGNSSSGGSGSIVNEVLGLGVGLQAMNVMGNQIKGLFNDVNNSNKMGETISINPNNICDNCGNELYDSANFCPKCGKPLKSKNSGLMTCPKCNKMVKKAKYCSECGNIILHECPNCGNELNSSNKFCPYCGKEIGEKYE